MTDTSIQSNTKPIERKELTLRVVVLGLLLAVVMGAANVYVGLRAGMTVSASIPAAVMAMLLFKMLFKNSTILEANQVQTCASAGESLAAGIIFTMPAMVLIGFWDSFDFWSVTIIALTGGLLGILFMIPMRKVFILNNTELAYPEGIACAAVLRAGEEEAAEGEDGEQEGAAKNLLVGGLLGAGVAIGAKLFGVLAATLEAATVVSSRIFYFGGDLSPMLIAIGFIVRLNVAILIFIGGAISWIVAIPLLGSGDQYPSAIDGAYELWSTQIRYVGVGAMVLGGFASLYSVRLGLIAAIRELRNNLTSGDLMGDSLERDIPTWAIIALTLGCVAVLAFVNYRFTSGVGITILSTIVMLVMGFFFTAVASYIVGLVGNSNSPVSGMTITAVLVAGGMLWLFNYTGMEAMVATLGIAAIVCCVAATSGDVCNDLKTGTLVGAAPFRQQIMQIAGVFVAAFVMSPVLNLLHNNIEGGIGGRELSAPQASLFASLARGFSGETQLPWDMIGYGVLVGGVILVVDWYLRVSGKKFRAHLMPIAVGMYLPFGLAAPILIGGLIAHFHSKGTPEAKHDKVLHRGVLFSSGVIAGEALMSVGLACLTALGVQSLDLGLSTGLVTALSLVAAALAVWMFYKFTQPSNSSTI
ncbi:oligopeptide transporter, OPT family [Gammaproteobacteria bacterium]|jgi:putative OPT family oligopeptide transporter|nr:oligopeptide transporter, OPT family [Pseudomonadales bacterium]MDC0414100.1 oligopeptide transporter, OPT family [Gammaproteobacteria bacterium]